MKLLLFALICLICGFCFGAFYEQETSEPQYVYVPEPYLVSTIREVIKEVEVIVPNPLREFQNQEALGMWQAQNIIERVGGRNCLDYALELQRRAIQDGYQMSIEVIPNSGGMGHVICSTVIGRKIIFLEPQKTTMNWVGAVSAPVSGAE